MILNRRLEFAIISPYLDKKYKNLTPEKYLPFEWEKDFQEQDLKTRKFKTTKEMKAMWDKIDEKDHPFSTN